MMPTYRIGDGGRWIQCLDCGRISFHPSDVQHRYCGYCNQFHDDKEMVANAERIRHGGR